ncbi:MAG TPA: alpha-amylase family glycosyl hydrolase [Kineosporiaceae bacterium]|nr:alpha-amylase family glycosyl hydrolase [Kineosporiaceae bacterium]
MTGWPDQPVVYEVDTWPWLRDLSGPGVPLLRLDQLPAEAWDAVVPAGVDAVWLMGVWERSPAGLAVALANPSLMSSFRAALPDLTPDDVVGSPYCIRRYVVDERLGGPAALAIAREQLRQRGARLVLDFVPNHVAPDHPWVLEHPERFVRGTAADRARDPDLWFDVEGEVVAHGRDPYFPPWPDVVQLDAFSPSTRDAMAETLIDIGEQCDGVRCDMAMLLLTDVFEKTWGSWVGPAPQEELWPGVLARVRGRHPDMVFVAEAYWDLEWELQQQGFDFCYDKRLYDRLVHEGGGSVRAHLGADLGYQRKLVRFTENHDEPRAATALPGDRARAAAVTIATLPGATLWHEGQFEGRRVQLPVFLGRRPAEPVAPELQAFSRRLLAAVSGHRLRDGAWSLLASTGWPDNRTNDNLVAWAWSRADAGHVVVVNLSDAPAQGRIPLPWPQLAHGLRTLEELLTNARLDRDGSELVDPGLFVDLPAWGYHVLALSLLPWEPPPS